MRITKAEPLSPEQALSLAAARVRSLAMSPYLAPLLYAVVPVFVTADEDLVAAVSERAHLLLGARFFSDYSPAERAFILTHEVWHLALSHCRRIPDAATDDHDRKLGSMAADLVINGMLAAAVGATSNARLAVPASGLFPERIGLPNGLSLYEYWDYLRRHSPPPPPAGEAFGHCGSGSGNPIEGEPGGSSEGTGDDVVSAAVGPGKAGPEIEAAKAQTASGIAEAAKSGKLAGDLPAGLLEELMARFAPPKVPWQKVLRRIVAVRGRVVAGATSYDTKRLSRRVPAYEVACGEPVYRARLVKVEPEVIVGLDTSGSMSTNDLADALSEVAGILRNVGGVTFLACDTEIHSEARVTAARKLVELVRGRGGTNLQPLLDYAAVKRPDVMVILTDGGLFRRPSITKGLKVIWVITPGGTTSEVEGTGDIIRIER